MKLIATVGILLALSACAAEHASTPALSTSMYVLNYQQPFVSRDFAERLALLVIDEKYSKDLFSAGGSPRVTDHGDTWAVMFNNALVSPADKSWMPTVNGRLVPRRLTITVRKKDAGIVSVT